MILKRETLSKSLRKGRLTSIQLLDRLSKAAKLPSPNYFYEAGGHAKYASHYYRVKFRIPDFLKRHYAPQDELLFETSVTGAGRDHIKQFAKTLAALEVVHRLELLLDVPRGGLEERLGQWEKRVANEQKHLRAVPVAQPLPGASWRNVPVDDAFPETLPANRSGRLDFGLLIASATTDGENSKEALMAAKALTITSHRQLPTVARHGNQIDGGLINFVNIRSDGIIKGHTESPKRNHVLNLDYRGALVLALETIYRQRGVINKQHRKQHRKKKPKQHTNGDLDRIRAVWQACERPESSLGMAKLFAKLPEHQFQELQRLLEARSPLMASKSSGVATDETSQATNNNNNKNESKEKDDASLLQARIDTFRMHQKEYPLPVDAVEEQILFPRENDWGGGSLITIVRGGTGSGKTTRIPLMLSLFHSSSSSTTPTPRVVVAQPRRLACQTAARRVAFEQGFEIGTHPHQDCPIGYSIRFESFPATGTRTVDFQTPGVLLRRAMDDPLLRDVTHLCIDEVHERNADLDLLVALAKRAVQQRAQHATLPPLRLVLMSATLDSSHWESYFADCATRTTNTTTTATTTATTADRCRAIATVDVPDLRRFPIETIHLGAKGFPRNLKSTNFLQMMETSSETSGSDYDEQLCEATAELAFRLFASKNWGSSGGSILCFLPGMDEIRRVDRRIKQLARNKNWPVIRYLHSSVPSGSQARVFEPGAKIILSTNLAETR